MLTQCSIIKPGAECTFAEEGGCNFGEAAETCYEVAERCEGCNHVQEWPSGRYCALFAQPAAKWAFGICNSASHVKVEKAAEKKRVNPLKASKKKMAGR